MSNFDDFADLNAAIADQIKLKADAAAAKAARDRQKRGGPVASATLAEDQARIAEWEARHEWRAEANIALFERETCTTCETVSERFVQFMRLEAHRHLRDSHRIVRADKADAALSNRVYVQPRLVPMCPDCAEAKGWLLANAHEVDWASETSAVGA
jgi:hypothetical protein